MEERREKERAEVQFDCESEKRPGEEGIQSRDIVNRWMNGVENIFNEKNRCGWFNTCYPRDFSLGVWLVNEEELNCSQYRGSDGQGIHGSIQSSDNIFYESHIFTACEATIIMIS